MRRLVLMRHAKAERGGLAMDDFDRGLTDEGKADAALIGKALAAAGIYPTHVLVSAAARTRQTWAQLDGIFPKAEVEFRAGLYHAEADLLRRAVEAEEETAETLMVIGHNPGIHAYALWLLMQGAAPASIMAKFERGFPTATAAVFDIDLAGRASYDGLYFAKDHGGGGGE